MKKQTENDKSVHWLVRPATIRWLWIIMFAILAASVILQFGAHIHGHFGLAESFGFNAWYGFITCVAMVFGAKLLGMLIKRKDTYYDD